MENSNKYYLYKLSSKPLENKKFYVYVWARDEEQLRIRVYEQGWDFKIFKIEKISELNFSLEQVKEFVNRLNISFEG